MKIFFYLLHFTFYVYIFIFVYLDHKLQCGVRPLWKKCLTLVDEENIDVLKKMKNCLIKYIV